MGKAVMGIGVVGGLLAYFLTIYTLFSTGETALAVIALVLPPADLVLAFVVDPALGFTAIASMVALFAGALLDDAKQERTVRRGRL